MVKIWQVKVDANVLESYILPAGPCERGEVITQQQIWEASRKFKLATPAQRGGFHPRHFHLMALGGQTAAAKLRVLREFAGAWPQQLRMLVP